MMPDLAGGLAEVAAAMGLPLWYVLLPVVFIVATFLLWLLHPGSPRNWQRQRIHAPVPGTDICRACGAIHAWAPGVVDRGVKPKW